MAWRYICEDGNDVAALLGISGSLDQDVECPQAPRKMRHVHWTNDTVMGFRLGRVGTRHTP
jgi:polyhydroxybutyrate depolymerase